MLRQCGGQFVLSPNTRKVGEAHRLQLKALLRKAKARTFDVLVNAIADILPRIKATECANYFADAGYLR